MEIVISNLEGISANIPRRGVDSQGLHLLWALNEEGGIEFQVPDSYITGTDFTMELHEATAGESRKHRWQITVSLNGGSAATYTSELTSSAVADTMTTRTVDFSTDGEISSEAIAADDTIYLQLKRIAAADTEDSNDIRLYTLTLQITSEPTAESGCTGRLGKIMDRVTFRVNEVLTRSTFITVPYLIDLCDDCTSKIAQTGYWKYEETLSLTDEVDSYDLLTLLTYPVERVQWIKWEDDGRPIHMVATRYELEKYRRTLIEGERIYFAMIESNNLIVCPSPSADLTGALRIFYSYRPDDFDCTTAYTPEIPPSHDRVYVAYCCKEIFARERGEQQHLQSMYQLWDSRFREEFSKLCQQNITPRFRLRPYRR